MIFEGNREMKPREMLGVLQADGSFDVEPVNDNRQGRRTRINQLQEAMDVGLVSPREGKLAIMALRQRL